MTHKATEIILISTTPEIGRGGISTALPAYFEAFRRAGMIASSINCHEDGSALHKLKIYALAILKFTRKIRSTNKQKGRTIVYLHTGPWFSMIRKLTFAFVGKIFGAKLICHVHSLSIDNYLHHTLGRIFCRSYFNQMDRVLVLTEWWRQRLQSSGIQNVEVVPNPLGEAFEQAANSIASNSKIHSDSGAIRILSMTRLVPGKGVDLVIRALSHLPLNYHLTIAGTGSEKSALEQLAKNIGVSDRVDFLGWVAGDARLGLLREHDIFALPSQNDSFGMGFIEAMAFGLPVVALNSGPIADVVPNNIAGFLIDHPDSKLLGEAIKKLESPIFRAEMGRRAQHWVIEQYSLQSVGLKLKEIVLSLNS